MNQIFESHKSEARMERHAEMKAQKAINRKLYLLPYDGLAETLHTIDGWLVEEGFSALSDGVYCGEDGRIHEQVGPHTWLSLSWYKMESGRYEIVAYLS